MNGVGMFTVAHVLRLGRLTDLDGRQAGEYRNRVGCLAAWCLDQGMPLDVEVVLHPEVVETFFASGAVKDLAPGSQAAWRTSLRRAGRLLTKKAPWTPNPQPYSRKQLAGPYTDVELDIIARDVRRQSTPARVRAATALMTLGLGVGLDGRWNMKVRGTDVEDLDGAVVVHVPAPHPRVVTARDEFADALLELAVTAGPAHLTGLPAPNRAAASKAAARVVIDNGHLQFQPVRLRSNLLLAHLAASTSVPVLRDAAGVRALTPIEDLLRFVPKCTESERRAQLRRA